MTIDKIFIGSWFQRTTLHLSEMYDFFIGKDSPLHLDHQKLAAYRKGLDIREVHVVVEDLEYIEVTTSKGIILKAYEDGLITLGKVPHGELQSEIRDLAMYYERNLSPALSYLFSLGAPIPKELANIKSVYPYFIVTNGATDFDIMTIMSAFGQKEHFEIIEEELEIYRGDKMYILNSLGEQSRNIEKFLNEQIFVREFKAQMHHYLNLHRVIWDNIADIKERGRIRGRDVGKFKVALEGYQKSVRLIGTRIDQMDAYLKTRGAVTLADPEMQDFDDVFQFKYDTLGDTLSYVKEIWAMTSNYTESALKVFTDLQTEATNRSIKDLSAITLVGVAGSLITIMMKTSSLDKISGKGLIIFFILVFVGLLANWILKRITLGKRYEVKNTEADIDIHYHDIDEVVGVSS